MAVASLDLIASTGPERDYWDGESADKAL